jgi:hypothetical protein
MSPRETKEHRMDYYCSYCHGVGHYITECTNQNINILNNNIKQVFLTCVTKHTRGYRAWMEELTYDSLRILGIKNELPPHLTSEDYRHLLTNIYLEYANERIRLLQEQQNNTIPIENQNINVNLINSFNDAAD